MGRRSWLAVLMAASALLFLVAAWIVGTVSKQEAVGQTSRDPATTTSTPAPPAPEATSASASPAASDDLSGDALSSTSASAQANESKGIPDLGAMDVIGNLKFFATDVEFRCAGPTPTKGDILWSCAATARGGSDSYGVTVVGDDPVTILSLTATARGVSDETAASFFSYVAGLCLPNTSPLDPEAWMRQNVPTGGRTFAGGAEISVYGTREARALEVVASGTF